MKLHLSPDTLALNPDLAGQALTVPTRRKYGNQPVVRDGITFDSLAEANHYGELRLREWNGEITDLVVHMRFSLEVNGVHIATYVSDLCYIENGRPVVVDVKSEPTRKLPAYRMKKRLMKALHGIDVVEVVNG